MFYLLECTLGTGSQFHNVFSVGAQFMPGLLDANLCKNKQTNNNITMLMSTLGTFSRHAAHISLFKVLFIVCFCLFLHKLTSNKPGIY